MFGLQVDCGLLLEPLGFIKVLEWVSEAGKALGLAVCPPTQSLTAVAVQSSAGTCWSAACPCCAARSGCSAKSCSSGPI